jgi:putative heme-binding domain-containing protein
VIKRQYWLSYALLVGWLGVSRVFSADPTPNTPDSGRKAVNLEALSRLKGLDLDANPSVKAVVMKLLDQVQGTPDFVEIVRDFHIRGQTQKLLAVAAKDPAGASGAEAMRLALQDSDTNAIGASLESTNAAKVVEALGNTGERDIVRLLLPMVTDLSKPLNVRRAAVQALVKVQDGAAELLRVVRGQRLPPDLRLLASSELNAVRWEALKKEAAELLPLPKTQSAQPLPPVAVLAKRTGNPRNGALVFRRETVGCYKCHQIKGEGVDFGPNLSEIGTKLAKDAIYESILDPSAGISFGYEAWQLDFKNGDDALGLIVSETADEVALKTVGGITTRYKKSDILRRTKQKLSIMPAGLEQTMSTDDLVDLVEYLSSLKKPTP